MRRGFCPQCGTPIFSLAESRPHQTIIRAGALDDTGLIGPQAEIWTDAAGFKAVLDKSASAADAIVAAVATKDAAAIGTAVADFQGTCGGCHAPFRGPPVP